MKKVTVFALMVTLLVMFSLKAQITVNSSWDFENDMPTGWTSSSATNVTVEQNENLAINGEKFARVKKGSGDQYIQTSLITVPAGQQVRLEFNHLPMTNSTCRIQLVPMTGNPISINGANVYDNKFRPGISGTGNSFKYTTYYSEGMNISSVSNLKPSMWRHEIFYLTNKIPNGETQFYIKFLMPASAGDNGYGWLIDDVKIYTTNASSATVPRFNNVISCPDLMNYPFCSDAEIEFQLSSQTSTLTSFADSLCIEYYTPGNTDITRVPLTLSDNGNYVATIPYTGIDSTVFWRAIVSDVLGNQTFFPYVGTFQEFKYVRPYTGNAPIKTSGTSSAALVFSTKFPKVSHQIRYSAQELKAAGYSAGMIGGFFINIKSRPTGTVVLDNFKVYMGSIDPMDMLDESSQYEKVSMYKSAASYTLPDQGWQYLEFDDGNTFTWDGLTDIVLKVCYDGTATYGETKVESYSSGNDNQYKTHIFEQGTTVTTMACTGMFNTSGGTIASKPNLRFNFINKCYFRFDPGIRQDSLLSVAAAEDCNDALSHMYTIEANTNTPLKVMLRNDGLDTLRTVRVKWMLDNDILTIDSSTWTGIMKPLDPITKIPQDTAMQYIATTTFQAPRGVHNLKIWVELPPDQDTINYNYDNDTIEVKLFVIDGPMSGTYAIGGAVEGVDGLDQFETFDDAFIMMINSTIGGSCVFKIATNNKDSIYYQAIDFPKCIQGISEENTLTFINDNPTYKVVFSPIIKYSEDKKTLNLQTNYIFNLHNNKYMKFENIAFSLPDTAKTVISNASSFNMITLNDTSEYIKFSRCKFLSYGKTTKNYDRISSAINIYNSKHIEIDSCLFDTPAKTIISIQGANPYDKIYDIDIAHCIFNIVTDGIGLMTENAINVSYAWDLDIIGNKFITPNEEMSNYSNLTSVYYALSLNDIATMNLVKNIFNLYSLSGMSLNSVDNSIFANNMLSLDNLNTNAIAYNQYGIYLQSGSNNKIVYNNVYSRSLNQSTKRTHGFALGTPTLISESNIVKNNIIVSEGYGYAISYRPSTVIETNKYDFDFSNNFYYKKNTGSNQNLPLFSYNGSNTTDTSDWKTQTKDTLSSFNEDPLFDSWGDELFTTCINLCAKGTTIEGVTHDYYNKERPSEPEKKPCIGAREFDPPLNNIYVFETGLKDFSTVSDRTYTDCEFADETIYVKFKNLSTNTIPENTLHLNYAVNGDSLVVPVIFADSIEPNVEKYFEFPATHNFTALNGNQTFELVAYSVLDIDSVKTNDTTSAKILSYYRLPAFSDQNISVKYGETATIDVTELCPNDSVYWFYTPDDTESFYKGHSFQTGNLYSDSTIYFARREETPLVRISEIQFYKDPAKQGSTQQLPNYISTNNAYEISNCGSEDIDLSGFKFLSYTGASITKVNGTYTFPENYILKGHSSVVMVAVNSLTVPNDVAIAVDANKFKFSNASAKGGLAIQNAAGTYIDAVTFNGAKFASTMNVPTSVWDDTEGTVTPLITSAGVIRNDVKGTTFESWTVADEFSPMTMGMYDDNLSDPTENLCLGHLTTYKITITDVPNFDPGISEIRINDISSENNDQDNPYKSCGLGESTISVTISNTGLQNLNTIPLVCEIYENGTLINTFNATYNGNIEQFGSTQYTFTETVDLTATESTKDYIFKIYTAHNQDIIHNNDTMYMYITSLQTPPAPTATPVTIDYATSVTLTAESEYQILWFEDETTSTILAEGDTYETPILYAADTFYAEAFIMTPKTTPIGADSAAVTSSAPAPSIFNAKTKNIKEQYLLKADTLIAYGYGEGLINAISSKITTITTSKASIDYSSYIIRMGTTDQQELTTWENCLTTVYDGTLSISKTDDANKWKSITFDEPYYWNGVSDLVVEVCYSLTNTATVTTLTTTTDYNGAIGIKDASKSVCESTNAPTSYTKIPYLSLDMTLYGCHSQRVPVIVNVQNAPTCDAGATAIVSPADESITSGENLPVQVEIKNYGSDPLTSVIIEWNVNGVAQTPYTFTPTTPIVQNATAVASVGDYTFTSGVVIIEANVKLECDNTADNDTVSRQFAACLGKDAQTTTLTINPNGGDYFTINEAIEDLKVSGICGPIVFELSGDVYDEKIYIPAIKGVTETNTITFKGDNAVITYTGSEEKDYLLLLDSATNISFEGIVFEAGATHSVVVDLKNTDDVSFYKTTFNAPVLTNPTMILVNMSEMNNNISFVADTFNNANTSILVASQKDNLKAQNIQIDSCVFTDFRASAAVVNDIENVMFRFNKLMSHANDFIADATNFCNISGVSEIGANEFVLTNSTSKIRNAIVVRNASFEDINPLGIVNNSISLTGTTKASKTYGIDVDSSNFVNIYYNTILINIASSNTSSRNLFVGKANTNVVVRNNNLDNQCGGYAYYVEGDGSQVLLSDNNNYTTKANKFTYWGNKDCATITALHTANTFETNSVSVENKFRADTCLEFLYPTDIVYKAEPLDSYTTDIYGNVRHDVPKPTIGAYEYQFTPIDAGVIRIISPVSNTSYIEGDYINVNIVTKNFGSQTISSLKMTAELKKHKEDATSLQTISETYTGNIESLDTLVYNFTDKLVAVLNKPSYDSLFVQIYTELVGDTNTYNDTMSLKIKVIPGKDLAVTSTKKQDANNKCGVNMRNQKIEAVIKNVGNKAVVAGDVINITYEIRGETGGLKKTATEQITFPYTYTNSSGNSVTLQSLQPNATIQYYTFVTTANLESTNGRDTSWTIRTFAKLSDDHNPLNDTSASVTFQSFVSPVPTIAHDTSVYYATYASVRSTHVDSLSIRWFHDSTDATPFYKPTAYAASTTLKIVKPIYADTSFYTNVLSKNAGACPSYFTKVTVHVKERCQSDIAALAIVEPPAQPKKAYTFMSEDTVKVKLTNYGTQTQTGFNISCSIKPTTPANAQPVIYTEQCDANIMMDDTVIYAFKKMFDFTEKKTTYEIKVWIENAADCVNTNDTTPAIKVIPLNAMTNDSKTVGDPKSLDITRVQLAAMDNMSSTGDDDYSDFTSSVTPPELFKGLKDSLLISTEFSSNMKIVEDKEYTGWIKAWIDWNRDGVFDTTKEQIYSAPAQIGGTNATMIEVPDTALNGYTLMRVIVSQDDTVHNFGPNPGNSKYEPIDAGEIEDYKIHISPAHNVNAELTRFVNPERIDTVVNTKVKVRLRNAGKSDLTAATITWIYGADTNTYDWTGMLHSSEIEDVEISDVEMNLGHNEFIAYVDVVGEEYRKNDTIVLNNYVQPVYTLPYETFFDEEDYDNYDFYAYEPDPKRTTNIWQMGTPSAIENDIIKSAFSKPNCWKTNLEGKYSINNTSVLYSPIFDISEIKPDTLSFMMKRELGSGASVIVEYMNYKGVWKTLGAQGDPYGTNWYDSEDGFTKSNVGWEKVYYSMEGVSGDLGKVLQIRFVFTSLDGHTSDGVAIDDFKVQRALRDYDAGVTKIVLTPDDLPSYGQYFYPKVTVHNYGKKELTSFKVCYLAEDMYITQCEDVSQTIPVGGDLEYTFNNGRYLNVSMPDPFSVMAYTQLNPNDLYTDNDTAYAYFVIGPLMKDAGILEITQPLTKVASNDQVQVAIKVKNYGIDPIEDLPVYYSAGNSLVSETIHFDPALNNGDEYVYTFKTLYTTPFGTVNLKSWTALDGDTYNDNDTLYKRIQTAVGALDLEAKYIVLDDASPNDYKIQLAIANHSTQPIDSIRVRYYLNGDPNDFVEEYFRGGAPLNASETGYHMFSRTIPRQVYQSICAHIVFEEDENHSNDTTCTLYTGYRDLQADTIFVEQNVNPDCKVQLVAHHIGTLAGHGKVTAYYVVNGDYSNKVKQVFDIAYDEPTNRRLQLTFDKRIPRNESGQYNVTAWVEYANDINLSNDTTSIVKVQQFVGIDDAQTTNEKFIVKQNIPNPFTDETVVEITIPDNGEISLIVQDMNGRMLYSDKENYSAGTHYETLPLAQLPAGTYYYSVYYNKQKITKKMIKIK